MASSSRQQSLLVAEDWKKLYQTFRQADFQSFDFETLRKSMIDYLKLYQYEDFNDFIESSEYVALIDLIAFLGQSIAFRADLNARENFIDTAERRDSILKLARLISYSPKRNSPAQGYLKIQSVSTTEILTDSAGNNLSNQVINWADSNNDNWQEQFNTIFNAAMVSTQRIGKPAAKTTLGSVNYQQYQLLLPTGTAPIYTFSSIVQSTSTKFEIVGTTIEDGVLRESYPSTRGVFDLLYKNDGQGTQSNNTGFFVRFTQGQLLSQDFNIPESISNRIVPVDAFNINEFDVWLFDVNSNGASNTLWKSVPAVANNNIVYNTSGTFTKKAYQITSRNNDQIDLNFGDGNFAQIPVGNFRVYYRVSNGITYKILPIDIVRIPIVINYVSRNNQVETLTISVSLTTPVTNASARETIEEIRQRAPQQYYTQNRMVNGEDYNIFPYTKFANIVKSKSVNRTSSGISRYLDVIDVTGKHSTTNIFGDDVILYADNNVESFTFEYATDAEVGNMISLRLNPIMSSRAMLHFYYANFSRASSELLWNQSTVNTNQCTGYFRRPGQSQPEPIGAKYSNTIVNGTLIKFAAPKTSDGKTQYFDRDNNLVTGTPNLAIGHRLYIFATIVTLINDGTNSGQGNFADGTGPVSLNEKIPSGASIAEFIPVWKNSFTADVVTGIITNIRNKKTFGLGFDSRNGTWVVISTLSSNSTAFNESTNPWLFRFDYASNVYTVSYRSLKYVVESALQTRFYFDSRLKIFDSKTGQLVVDQVKILKANYQPDNGLPYSQDQICYVISQVIESDGYVDTTKIEVSYADTDNDGVPDDPDFFENIVFSKSTSAVVGLVNRANSTRGYVKTSLVFYRKSTDQYNYIRWVPLAKSSILVYSTVEAANAGKNQYPVGQLFYVTNYVGTSGTMYQSNLGTNNAITLSNVTVNYLIREGRQDLFFQYKHNSPHTRRIDPSPVNIIDLYVLTKQYDNDYRLWAQDSTGTIVKPIPPTSEELASSYSDLDEYKMTSDTIIFNNARYKPIFGAEAAPSLRAIFKVVKNQNTLASDAEVRSSLISAVNTYFAIENWDFGETFYFSEMVAYLHQRLATIASSIVIVPAQSSQKYGGLQQINAEPDEILISTARVEDVTIISSITAVQLNSLPSSN
jgi:hypothetical protein